MYTVPRMADTAAAPKPTRYRSINLRVTAEERAWLEQHALDEERSISAVLRLALKAYVKAQS